MNKACFQPKTVCSVTLLTSIQNTIGNNRKGNNSNVTNSYLKILSDMIYKRTIEKTNRS